MVTRQAAQVVTAFGVEFREAKRGRAAACLGPLPLRDPEPILSV